MAMQAQLNAQRLASSQQASLNDLAAAQQVKRSNFKLDRTILSQQSALLYLGC